MRGLALISSGQVAPIDLPTPTGRHPRVSVEASMLGATDTRALRSHAVPYPTLLGSCAVGRLRGDPGHWIELHEGDRVLVRTRDGAPAGLCAEEIAIHDGLALHRIPDGISAALAAAIPEIAVVVRGLRRATFISGDSLAIYGLGARGLLLIEVAHLLGASQVIAVDHDARAREAAVAAGATLALVPSELTKMLKDDPERAPRCVAVLASDGEMFRDAVRAVAHLGTLVLVDSAPEYVVIPEYYGEMILKETTILGSHSASDADVGEALALALAPRSKFPLVAQSKVLRLHEASLHELADIAARLREGDAVLLSFDGA